MNREDTIKGLSHLLACTPGWNDDAVTVYANQCEDWNDGPAFIVAMERLSLHWSKPVRPSMFDVRAAYDAEVRQRQMDYAIPSESATTTYPTLEQGVAIAREAYESECRRLGKEPNFEIFDSWVFTLANKRAARLATSE